MTVPVFLLRTSVMLALGVVTAYGQCEDSTTVLWYETTAVRLNGNSVRLNG